MLTLHNKDFTTKYGTINTTIEAFVEEERNGLFELSFIMLNTDSLFNYVKEDNIVVANANDTLLNQKFRIYMTRKLMNNRLEVFARHISFDLMYDYIDSINFENQSCEYALNMLFRNSQFSKHYKGYSDIINAQDYNMSMANILEAIGGKEGSILDTFGTGAELLRDNENIHALNKRGYDNSVSIEYKKNLTGFELEEDTTELITRILPYAKYTPQDEEGNSLEEVIIKANYVDSPLIANYSHPFIKAIDYSDKFDDENIPTVDKLRALAELEYKNNKVDMPKQNFKIEFMPLSKCVGYEGLSDNISLCDTVTIKDTRYNINTQAKVIKTTFNVLKNRYESMELGEPKTSLGDIIGNNNSTKGEKGDKGDKGEPGKDGNIGDFPNSLPSIPVVTTKVYGFANIEISWTFDDKVYYQYEVYASKEADFVPNTFNLVHKGQTSTYMYQAKPNETWYFKVCCVNSHGERTDFGNAYATTSKIDDLSNYVGEMAIGEALIGTLSLDRGWVGELKGNYINAKNLSVTDGNGKRTLDIDSFGNVNLDVASLKINSKSIENEISSLNTKLTQTANDFNFKVENIGAENLIKNSDFSRTLVQWNTNGVLNSYYIAPNGTEIPNSYGRMIRIEAQAKSGIYQRFNTVVGQTYTVSFYAEANQAKALDTQIGIENIQVISLNKTPGFKRYSFTFTATSTNHVFIAYTKASAGTFYLGRVMITQGATLQEYRKATSEIYSTNVKIDIDGIEIASSGTNTKTQISSEGFAIKDISSGIDLLKSTSEGVIAKGGRFIVTDEQNGSTRLWGRDIVINDQRALVGTGNTAQENLIKNTLYINYLNDFTNGVVIGGEKLTLNGSQVLSEKAFSKTQNGYIKLNNGLMLQWGVAASVATNVSTAIKLPVGFPNMAIAGFANVKAGIVSNNNGVAVWVDQINISVQHSFGNTRDIYWFAIGF